MTREEILAMEPGRELDVLVAKAMGWTDVAYQLGGRYLNPKDDWPLEYEGWFGKPPGWNGSADDLLPEVPYYSTQIEAAWELQSKGPFAVWPYDDGKWAAACGVESPDWFYNMSGWYEVWQDFRCDTPMEALCKAFLLATLEEQPMG